MLTRQQVLYGLERVELRTTSIFDECPLHFRQDEPRQSECSGDRFLNALKGYCTLRITVLIFTFF